MKSSPQQIHIRVLEETECNPQIIPTYTNGNIIQSQLCVTPTELPSYNDNECFDIHREHSKLITHNTTLNTWHAGFFSGYNLGVIAATQKFSWEVEALSANIDKVQEDISKIRVDVGKNAVSIGHIEKNSDIILHDLKELKAQSAELKTGIETVKGSIKTINKRLDDRTKSIRTWLPALMAFVGGIAAAIIGKIL